MENKSCENCYHNDLCHSGSYKKCNTMEHENFLDKNSEIVKLTEINTRIAQKQMFNSIRAISKKLTAVQFEKFLSMEMDEAFEYVKTLESK